jgi:hypothetical protein
MIKSQKQQSVARLLSKRLGMLKRFQLYLTFRRENHLWGKLSIFRPSSLNQARSYRSSLLWKPSAKLV